MHGQYMEGMEKGLEKGMEKGIEKGIAKGMAKGREEGREETNFDNARKMKAKGFAIEDIAEITGLTKELISTI